MASEVTPQLGLRSFNCPICHALAAQTWFEIGGKIFDQGKGPMVLTLLHLKTASENTDDERIKKRLCDAAKRLGRHPITWLYEQYPGFDQQM
jgi:hypothetical protein